MKLMFFSPHINFCTTSLLEKHKCDWLSEAGAVYGIAPPLQCIIKDHEEACLKAIAAKECDVAVAGSDWLVKGKRDIGVTPILHELTPILENTNTVVAYVRMDANIVKLSDLRGKAAAFPSYDGMSWHAVRNYLQVKENISYHEFVRSYFKEICAPGGEDKIVGSNIKNCYSEGEHEAYQSLLEGKTDVAFVSMKIFEKSSKIMKLRGVDYATHPGTEDILPVCPDKMQKYCLISWSSVGHLFALTNLTAVRRQEIINVFGTLDRMFGKRPPFHTPMFSMYGPFNHELDILFHNNTRLLGQDYTLDTHPYDGIPMNYEKAMALEKDFIGNISFRTTPSLFLSVMSVVTVLSFLFYSI